MVTYNYPNETMLPGETKPDNLRAKGIADMWKTERKNMLSALGAPGFVPAKHPMYVKKVDKETKKSPLFKINK
jgi:hypothetical protein